MASCVVLEDLSADELSLFLSSKGIPQKVLDNFQSHSIDGETFLSMSDGHLKEVAEKIPDRVKLKKIIDSTISAKKENRSLDVNGSHCSSTLNVPSQNWHHTFVIPSAFSLRTEEALATGQITRRVRTEIIQALSMSMMIHTRTPSSDQYNTVCRKLIETYPILKDEIGSTGYGSWKKKLRDRFKFLRRPSTYKTDSVSIEPSPKRQKTSKRLGSDTSTCVDDLDDVMLTTKLAELQHECSKRKKDRSLATIQSLTSSTFTSRRKWITNVQPPVVEILEQYPSLKIRKVFRMEFKTIIGLDEKTSIHSLMESWPTWEKRIIAYSRLEFKHRPKLKQLLTTLDEQSEGLVDKGLVAFQLLSELLIPKSRHERLVQFVKNSDDLAVFSAKVQLSAPYMIVCHSAEETTFHIMVEEEVTCELSSFESALIHLVGSYFLYDIAYPKPVQSLLLMIQHYVFGLEDSQQDTPAVIEIVTSLKKMDSILYN